MALMMYSVNAEGDPNPGGCEFLSVSRRSEGKAKLTHHTKLHVVLIKRV